MTQQNMLGAFHQWLDLGPAGSAFIYHTGHLAADRSTLIWDGPHPRLLPIDPCDQMGLEAWGAYERDLVLLCQRKVSPGIYQYLAVKKR